MLPNVHVSNAAARAVYSGMVQQDAMRAATAAALA